MKCGIRQRVEENVLIGVYRYDGGVGWEVTGDRTNTKNR